MQNCKQTPYGHYAVSPSHNGLESSVVILAEIDGEQVWNLRSILYVGCSRARSHLVLLVAKDVPEKIGALLL